MASFQEMIDKDKELMLQMNEKINQSVWLSGFFEKVVSKNPFKDVVLVLWFFFVFGLFQVGVKHFWVVIMNFVCVVPIRLMIEAKRPYEYDINLKPKTDLSAESFAFPSLESYMSVVIMGHLFFHLNSFIFLPVAVFVIFVVGLSRIYSRSRFPHQILGSYFLGFIGLLLGMHFCERMSFHTMAHLDHGFCVGAILVVVIVGVGMVMENNQSYLLYIPRKEFVRVLSEIVSGGGKGISANDEDAEDDEGPEEEQKLVKESPRTLAIRQAQLAASGRKRTYVKSDSLYYLQKSLEEREARIQSEILMMNPNHGNLAARNRRSYGAEDFFSSDSEYEDN